MRHRAATNYPVLLLLFFIWGLYGCKEKSKNDFEPADNTGTTQFKGTITKTVIRPDGAGGWDNSAVAPAEGVRVSVSILRSTLYPNSNSSAADVYETTSDKNGFFEIKLKTNASGVTAKIGIDGFSGTLDTLINGAVKKGDQGSFLSFNTTATLFMGQPFTLDHHLVYSKGNASFPVLATGTAIVTGSVGVKYLKEAKIGNIITYFSVISPILAGNDVFLELENDPDSGNKKLYQAKTDDKGYYRFTLKTVGAGNPGFNQNAKIWVNDLASTLDTIKLDNTLRKGRPGVFSGDTASQSGLYNSTIRNAVHLNYLNFFAD